MRSRNDKIIEWVVNKIKSDYKDDISLLVIYGSQINRTATHLSDLDFYFIPKTERAYELCKTFIIEGIGYDLFPMSWERVEGLAEFDECLTPLLANVKIGYSNSEEDVIRFNELQEKLNKNMMNSRFMLEKATNNLEKTMISYTKMLMRDDICVIRTLAGQILMSLSDSVAYANQTYFSKGLKTQFEDLYSMKKLPTNYLLLYKSIIKSNSSKEIKQYCYEIIKETESFLNFEKKHNISEKGVNYQELVAIYEELVSTWNKIIICCDSGNYQLAYISGVNLQSTLDWATLEYGLNTYDLMSSYDMGNLQYFKSRAIEVQKEFVELIEHNNVEIKEYRTVEEFIKANL